MSPGETELTDAPTLKQLSVAAHIWLNVFTISIRETGESRLQKETEGKLHFSGLVSMPSMTKAKHLI